MTRESRIIVAIAGLTALIVLALLLALFRNQEKPFNLAEIPDGSRPYPIVGREHIPVGALPTSRYNSNPPTSGDHYPATAPADLYEERVPDAFLIHNLEHGHVWLSWRDADDEEVVELFRQLREQFPEWVVASYRPENEARLVAAAWGRLLPLEAPERDALTAFIMRYRDKAPESVPG